jgi:hypothetical protein
MDMDKVDDGISEYNYYSEMIVEKEDGLERINERIQNAFDQGVINDLEIEKEQHQIEIQELREKQGELMVNF